VTRGRLAVAPALWTPRLFTFQLLNFSLAAVVVLELLLDSLTKDPQCGDEGVELVQRVRSGRLRTDLELEIDPVGAIGISRIVRGLKFSGQQVHSSSQ
jgi:hypothetical protein